MDISNDQVGQFAQVITASRCVQTSPLASQREGFLGSCYRRVHIGFIAFLKRPTFWSPDYPSSCLIIAKSYLNIDDFLPIRRVDIGKRFSTLRIDPFVVDEDLETEAFRISPQTQIFPQSYLGIFDLDILQWLNIGHFARFTLAKSSLQLCNQNAFRRLQLDSSVHAPSNDAKDRPNVERDSCRGSAPKCVSTW